MVFCRSIAYFLPFFLSAALLHHVPVQAQELPDLPPIEEAFPDFGENAPSDAEIDAFVDALPEEGAPPAEPAPVAPVPAEAVAAPEEAPLPAGLSGEASPARFTIISPTGAGTEEPLSEEALSDLLRTYAEEEAPPLAPKPADTAPVVAPESVPRGEENRFKTQILPDVIYKKEYRQENTHLPKAIDTEDLDRLMFKAAGRGDVNGIRALLNLGRGLDPRNIYGNTPLIQAALHGKIDTTRLLLARGAFPDAQNDLGLTALHIAAQTGREDIVKLLLHMGADPNIKSHYGHSPLQFAATGRHFAVAQALLSGGAHREGRFFSELIQNKSLVRSVRHGKADPNAPVAQDGALEVNRPFAEPQPMQQKPAPFELDVRSVERERPPLPPQPELEPVIVEPEPEPAPTLLAPTEPPVAPTHDVAPPVPPLPVPETPVESEPAPAPAPVIELPTSVETPPSISPMTPPPPPPPGPVELGGDQPVPPPPPPTEEEKVPEPPGFVPVPTLKPAPPPLVEPQTLAPEEAVSVEAMPQEEEAAPTEAPAEAVPEMAPEEVEAPVTPEEAVDAAPVPAEGEELDLHVLEEMFDELEKVPTNGNEDGLPPLPGFE